MKLSTRQAQILEYYTHNKDNYITAKKTAKNFNVSIRTILTELKSIKEFSQLHPSFQLETLPSKGTKLTILDRTQFKEDLALIKKRPPLSNDHTYNRANSIIKFLLDQSDYVSKYYLTEKFFISETTLYNHITEAKKILAKYQLKLEYKTNLGYKIKGSELNKRTCIAKIGLDYKLGQRFPEKTNEIYTIVADTFIKYKYRINEETLLNITAHVSRSLQRTQSFHFIEQTFDQDLSSTDEYTIADEILSSFIPTHTMKDEYYINEVNLLTQIILGKLDYTGNNRLQEDINQFIDIAFESIYQKFSINFDSVDNLRLLLALHLVPLFYRIQSGTQLKNPLHSEIEKSFPQAYDIALYFSLLIKEKFNFVVSKDETSFLTLYFNYGMENYLSISVGKKILILTSLRKSETILLKHKILNWLPNQLEVIDFVAPQMIDSTIKVNEYDAVFTTEDYLEKYQNIVPSINIFPTEQDLRKIELAIQGYTNYNSILSKFTKDCFFYGEASSKEEALKIVIEKAVDKYQLDKSFGESVHAREEMVSTYFGNRVATPHTLTPNSDETFVSVVVLKNDVLWDKKNSVRIILLVSIAKNNPKELQFWDYLTTFLQSEKLVNKVIENPTFSCFLSTMKESLKNKFE
ncbi:BglG family transcription antiterminator [Enterococcus raffinosus]|uniref:Uncharacterized protein n=1 Tax=Enterococcus raffinosus ATCC 49464 TaxID=1158602 RepID=R2QU25_9ENTE|nr:PTS sugar transporter subunit IIA [Enterococcus raffinosus]EOH74985.1 hypothetical protein UAK_03849 [Enterococcus raffinosus ATCC 49464]EOT82164.1 hypothetical protein I590_00589 [Enterococcus raffinosus ATCC 49464]OJG84632.1 hypothetical protein RV13_GL001754 [Enterococcus raffinosus]UXK04588.1 PTS sugar transporter subunit IIA [Enterococcus raffinosus]